MSGELLEFANGTMGQREPVKDMARILGRWVDVMAARTFAQSTVDELAQYSPVPVINALTNATLQISEGLLDKRSQSPARAYTQRMSAPNIRTIDDGVRGLRLETAPANEVL